VINATNTPVLLSPVTYALFVQKWKALKEAGANETNPEFAQLSAILQSFKQRSNAHQQQMQAMQQMNRGNQDMSPSAGPQANGMYSNTRRCLSRLLTLLRTATTARQTAVTFPGNAADARTELQRAVFAKARC
jgi:hypothetical protein